MLPCSYRAWRRSRRTRAAGQQRTAAGQRRTAPGQRHSAPGQRRTAAERAPPGRGPPRPPALLGRSVRRRPQDCACAAAAASRPASAARGSTGDEGTSSGPNQSAPAAVPGGENGPIPDPHLSRGRALIGGGNAGGSGGERGSPLRLPGREGSHGEADTDPKRRSALAPPPTPPAFPRASRSLQLLVRLAVAHSCQNQSERASCPGLNEPGAERRPAPPGRGAAAGGSRR